MRLLDCQLPAVQPLPGLGLQRRNELLLRRQVVWWQQVRERQLPGQRRILEPYQWRRVSETVQQAERGHAVSVLYFDCAGVGR
jgi:hypothetical protein